MTDAGLYLAVQAVRPLLVGIFALLAGATAGRVINLWRFEGHFSEDKTHLAVFWYLCSLILGVAL